MVGKEYGKVGEGSVNCSLCTSENESIPSSFSDFILAYCNDNYLVCLMCLVCLYVCYMEANTCFSTHVEVTNSVQEWF